MREKIFFIKLFIFYSVFVVAQDYSVKEVEALFESRNYSAAQAICKKIINSGHSDEAISYYHARCSKELFLSDALKLYQQYSNDFPYSIFSENVNQDLALLHFRNEEYDKSIYFLSKLSNIESDNRFLFKLAYANFSIDSLSEASYYFSKLMVVESKYASTSRYYYAYISYKEGLYATALDHFKQLIGDDKFGSIIPYYITQIYFYQKKYNELINFAAPLIANVIPSRVAEMNRLLAESYYSLSNYERAIVHFNNYLSAENNSPPIVHFLLGQSYYNEEDYKNAVLQLEKVTKSADSIMQNSAYFLGASYLKTKNYHYALQAFKKASLYDCNLKIREDAYFNYAKLSYQLDLPFDNTLKVLQTYLQTYNHPLHKKEIENLMVSTLQGTSRYLEAYTALQNIHVPTFEQKKSIQQLSYFLGVRAYNSLDYRAAIDYFSYGNNYQINSDLTYLISFWLADCYFQLSNYEDAADMYANLTIVKNKNLIYYDALHKYNIAYCYFKQNEYHLSNKYFRIYEKLAADSMRLNDAYLRIADGFFMLSQYSLAEKYYEKAVAYNLFDTDYALYNRSLTLGLIGKHSLKIELLEKLKSNYVNSAYYDNAISDIAEHYKNNAKHKLALQYFSELLSISKDKDLIANAYLSKGIIYFNSNRIDNAIEEFLFVINNYSKTKYFKEALSGLQSAYASLGQIEKYLTIIDELPEVSISKAEQDSLIYNTAFMKFSEGDYLIANRTFNNYIQQFKNGIFINDAKYYNAFCALNLGDTVLSIILYNELVEQKVSKYEEASLTFLARRYYKLNNFELSNKYYEALEEIVSSNSLKREVIIRLMYGNENINNDLAFKYAKEVIMLDKTDNWLLSKANIVIARNEFKNGNYAKSRKTFEKVERLSNYDEGAEAKYYLAYLTYLDDNLQLAEEMIFQLSDQYSSDHFIAKSFLLLADIYISKDNNFQAKATLESIIENHDGEDMVNVARKKWEQIIEGEIAEKQVLEEQSYIDILDYEVDYEIEFDIDSAPIIDKDYEVQISDTLKILIDSLDIINNNIVDDETE